ncbi:MAG: hypothetical protein AUI14_19500 [Actinobacteria bacterium 13_2_20CM_2_71_6]|nr:MAG: hypothetical protein AUI14_19500 [Actinobacteria bacterium 13_2_20CM_2_71_6]
MATTTTAPVRDNPAGPPRSVLAPLRGWLLERGILFAFLQMPIAALFAGYLLRLTTLPLATLGVFVSFAGFTTWVSYRRRASTDPDEPVHHLHRYALYAILPYTVFSLARIPAFYTSGIVYWQLWYGFGNQLTGEPATQLASLVPGMVLYTIQGMGLAMSYYVLFKRHTLLNAVLFLGVQLPALFCYIFPVFALAGATLGPAWYLVHWAAHLAMAVVAWAVPKLWTGAWPRLGRPGRTTVLAVAVAVAAAPYAFAVERAVDWQYPRQHTIDQHAFATLTVTLADGPTRQPTTGTDARYGFTLRLGPRTYTNAGLTRALDAASVDITATVTANGATVAWCTGHAAALPSPNTVRDPAAFTTALHRLNYTDLPVTCTGPATTVQPGDSLQLTWLLDATVKGDRDHRHIHQAGHATTVLH